MVWTSYEAFAGIGAWGKALERVTARHGDTHEVKGYWEFDKYASNAFAAVHNVSEGLNHWDITEDKHNLESAEIFFYSPPCQTFSLAGKREGRDVDKGNLFWNALRKIKAVKPKYAIMENVANLAQQFESDFKDMLISLDEAGYISYNKVLNSKDYGIPQNRERIFIVSIRKDVYESGVRFEWPEKMELKLRLKDLLESDVDEKYYISDSAIKRLIGDGSGYSSKVRTGDDIAGCVLASDYNLARGMNLLQVEQIGNISESNSFGGNPQVGRVYSSNGLSPTLSTMQGGGQEPKILVKSATSCNQGIVLPCIAASRGRDKDNPSNRATGNKNMEQRLELKQDGTSNTLTSVQKDNYVVQQDLRIRKLTPLECFRLQGFDDEDYYKAVEAYDKKWKVGASDSQMYKRACNSITVNVIEEILEQLLYQRKQEGAQLSLF